MGKFESFSYGYVKGMIIGIAIGIPFFIGVIVGKYFW